MKLQTNQLRQFKAASSGIKQNGILPIYSYLKFDNNTIAKNNGESFVIMEADVDGSYLLDERLLMSFVDATTADELTVTIKGSTATITDGKTKKLCPTDDVKLFPTNTEPTSDEVELAAPILEDIKIASQFTMDDNTMPFKECVFVGGGLVAASTGFISYTKQYEALQTIVLTKSALATITRLDGCNFSENDTYQFYTTGNLKYGFIKNDTKFVSMLPFNTVPDGTSVVIDKTEIIKFCEMCINDCPGRIVLASFKDGSLLMEDAAYELTNTSDLSTPLEDFKFNTAFMLRLLKSVPDTSLTFTRSINKYFITGASGFVSLIMECQ